MMKVQIQQLVLLFLASSALHGLAQAAGDGDIIIGREVPSRSAIRHGDPSPDVSEVNTSQSGVLVDAARQVVSISSQAGETVLGAVRGSVTSQTAQLQGLSVTALTSLPFAGAARPGGTSGSGSGVGAAGISQQLQSGFQSLQPLSGLAH